MAFKPASGSLDFLNPLNMAQVSTGSGCCCQAMPCMPMCQAECPDKKAVIPEPRKLAPVVPDPVRDVVFNMDMIMTTLMTQLAEETPDQTIIPGPEDPSKVTLVQDVVTPIIIQFINNDVMPAIPTCTFPKGQSADDYGLADGSFIDGGEAAGASALNVAPDAMDILRETMKLSMEDWTLPEGVDGDALIEESLAKSADIMSDVNITDEEKMQNISLVIKGMHKTVHEHSTDVKPAEDLTEELVEKMEEAGDDNAADMAEAIEDIIKE